MGQDEIEIGLAIIREMVRRGQRMHICEPFERSFFISNWTAAWRDLDVSLVISGAKEGKGNTKPKFLVLGSSREMGIPLRCKSYPHSRSSDAATYIKF